MKGVKRIKWEKLITPAIMFIIVLFGYFFLPSITPSLEKNTIETIRKIVMSIVFIFGGFVINRLINIIINYNMRKYNIDKADNLEERKTQTKFKYIRIVLNIIIFLISIALALRQFESMRQLSTSILASAGIIGIVLAFSAQKLLANVLAGFEIAFSQPIKIDDVVIVENEWGRIEEINATNVVVKIWDQRRMVLPITYFVEKPFQNWTKKSADIWGTAEFYVDYKMPIKEMRKELTKILKSTELWDGKVDSLQVTDTNDKTMKVRALMSARNSPDAWDLRCYVREKMIDFLQKKHPDKLPILRAEVEKEGKKSSKNKK